MESAITKINIMEERLNHLINNKEGEVGMVKEIYSFIVN